MGAKEVKCGDSRPCSEEGPYWSQCPAALATGSPGILCKNASLPTPRSVLSTYSHQPRDPDRSPRMECRRGGQLTAHYNCPSVSSFSVQLLVQLLSPSVLGSNQDDFLGSTEQFLEIISHNYAS